MISFCQSVKAIHCGKTIFSTNNTEHPYEKKKKNLISLACHMQERYNTDINMKANIVKLLEENRRKSTNVEQGRISQDTKGTHIKEKIDELGFIKIKNMFLLKGTGKKMKS